jgi:hypothetical protein
LREGFTYKRLPLSINSASVHTGARHTDLTDSIRVHLYGCAMLPVEVRRRAQAAREAARSLVKQSGQLSDRADVLLREAEAALYALLDTMRQPPTRSGTKHPGISFYMTRTEHSPREALKKGVLRDA